MSSQELIGKCRQKFEELSHKEYDWVSFYNGWLEGRVDLIDLQVSKMTDGELGLLSQKIQDEFRNRYVEVQILNTGGNIARTIQEETGFKCYHKIPTYEYSGSIGTNYIRIPRKEYSEEIKQQLIQKYENV